VNYLIKKKQNLCEKKNQTLFLLSISQNFTKCVAEIDMNNPKRKEIETMVKNLTNSSCHTEERKKNK
jgi:hypothetical protein